MKRKFHVQFFGGKSLVRGLPTRLHAGAKANHIPNTPPPRSSMRKLGANKINKT